MTHLALSLGIAPDWSLLLAVGAPVAAIALVLAGWAIGRRGTRSKKRPASLAVKVAALAAVGCTAYSADTSWNFAGDYLDMEGTIERAALFGCAELTLFATALLARQNLAVQGAPGLPGTLIWVITGVQVIPAYAESGLVGGTVRAIVGPVMAAVLWHQAMGLELRLRKPGAASNGLIATLGRGVRERLLSRLGITTRDRDAAQITRERATTNAVDLAARLAERTPQKQQNWRGRRLTRRLSKALARSTAGSDAAQRVKLLDQLAARRHALTLARVPLPSPWSPHQGCETTTTVPCPAAKNAQVLGPREHAERDRGPDTVVGRVPHARDCSAGTVDHTEGTRPAEPEPCERLGDSAGTDHAAAEGPAQATEVCRGPKSSEAGTDTAADRGPTAPLPRKPTPKAKASSKRGGRSRSPQPKRPPRATEHSVEDLIEQVRPHIPALLDRDGNVAVTRVQLREILRNKGLKGGRNDRLSLVLQQLRSDETTTATRSTAQ